MHSPQFSAHVYCGQTAGSIRIPLGTEVGLSPGDIVLDGDPAPSSQRKTGTPPPLFGPCLLWPKAKRSPISATAELLLIYAVIHKKHQRSHFQQVTQLLHGYYISRESLTTRNVLWSRVSVCVCVSVYLCVCLSAAACPHHCTDPYVTWGNGRGCPLVCAVLGGFAIGARVTLLWQHNANANVSEYMLALALCLVHN